jgi:hypothetical protein
MSTRRQRMNEAMVLRGFAERTRETYQACVSGLAKYYGRSPDTLDTAAIQAYLLHLITERKLAYASINQAVCAIRFLFAVACQQEVAFVSSLPASGGPPGIVVPPALRWVLQVTAALLPQPQTTARGPP